MTMTDETTDTFPARPAWLAPLLQRRDEERAKFEEGAAIRARHRAQLVNQLLADLGITPARIATSSGQYTRPAILIEPWTLVDEAGVIADWEDGEPGRVMLYTITDSNRLDRRAGFGPLTSIDDVVKALYEGPAAADVEPEPDDHEAEACAYLKIAEKCHEYDHSDQLFNIGAAQAHATLATLTDRRIVADLRYRLAAIERLIVPVAHNSVDQAAALVASAVHEIARGARTPEDAVTLLPPGWASALSGLAR